MKIARKVGYPVMIKASAGGGGKGMRIARDDAEARDGFRSAHQRGEVSLRRRPRLHREIHRGAAPHRDPGARRRARQRHPSRRARMLDPAPPPEGDRGGAVARSSTRRRARRWARRRWRWPRRSSYRSAGTVEFIVDGKRNFYFLEMNTRLQVEHPVTECVTGLDLVEMDDPHRRRREAADRAEGREAARAGRSRRGVYAEDPLRGFLPSIGRLTRYAAARRCRACASIPACTRAARSRMYYDPMIAKLVGFGKRRATRRSTAPAAALDAYVVRGVSHNIALPRRRSWRIRASATGGCRRDSSPRNSRRGSTAASRMRRCAGALVAVGRRARSAAQAETMPASRPAAGHEREGAGATCRAPRRRRGHGPRWPRCRAAARCRMGGDGRAS